MLDKILGSLDELDEKLLIRVFQPLNLELLCRFGWSGVHTARALMWAASGLLWMTLALVFGPMLFRTNLIALLVLMAAAAVFYFRLRAHDRYLAGLEAAEAERLTDGHGEQEGSVYQAGGWVMTAYCRAITQPPAW